MWLLYVLQFPNHQMIGFLFIRAGMVIVTFLSKAVQSL